MQSGTLKKKKILNSRIKNKNIQIQKNVTFFCNNSTNMRVSRIQERN